MIGREDWIGLLSCLGGFCLTQGERDSRVWGLCQNGRFTTKSFFKGLDQVSSGSEFGLFKGIWIKGFFRVNFFL